MEAAVADMLKDIDACLLYTSCDLTGKQLKSYTLQPDMPTGKIVIPASDLTAGMYLYALVIGVLIMEKMFAQPVMEKL